MKVRRFGWTVLLWALALLVSACSPAAPTATVTPSPSADLAGFTPQQIATLNSLQKVGDYPLYVMHYSGAYSAAQPAGVLLPGEFACSLFAALADSGSLVYGRNFDWDYSPALLLYTHPPDGYASVSMVDLAYLGLDPASAGSLTDLSLAQRAFLLDAPALPFDGMNEHGLVVGMAAVMESRAGFDPAKPTLGSLGVIRRVLDSARNIAEAVAIFAAVNIDFSGGPPVHYLVADASGDAVLLEYVDGEMVLLPNDQPWHLATNHLRARAVGDEGCFRYWRMQECLQASHGRLDDTEAMDLLEEVAQAGSTQWSIVYNFSRGEISLALGRDYAALHAFQLPLENP